MLTAEIMPALQGEVPAAMTSCSLDGTPNTTFFNQAWYVDHETVALTSPFFIQTTCNISENPNISVKVINPVDFTSWELSLSLMDGPFEALTSIAGKSNGLMLIAADFYKVNSVRKCEEEWIDQSHLTN
jgi:hypothetical protein